MLVEGIAVLVGLISWISGGELMSTLYLMVRILLWGQIATGVLGLVIYGGLWFVVTVLGGLGGAAVAEEKVGGLAAAFGGGLFAVGALSAAGILGLLIYLIKKALMIGGCVLFLGGFPANTVMMAAGGIAYFVGWMWQRSAASAASKSSS
jgi:hypothetical protein